MVLNAIIQPRIANVTELLKADGRTVWARRFKDLCDKYIADLGGVEKVATSEQSIIRRIATLEIELERMESAFANAGQASDSELDLYQRCAGNLRRLFESIGLGPRCAE